MSAKSLMFMGTGSDVGKSLIVAGLCRLLANRGLRVRPFKPQNMSNNAAVTADGGEIGRAQALQALAARVPTSVHMNPVLLKPQSQIGAQIVVRGQMRGSAKAREYQALKAGLMPEVLDSFARMKAEADIVLVEGAGSASEINLRANDIANMGFARAADVPVVLIGDIDRGGVIASLVGTKTVLPPEDAALIAGFLINKMRGDVSLFADGMAAIERLTGWRGLGIVPHFAGAAKLPAEDALALRETARWSGVPQSHPHPGPPPSRGREGGSEIGDGSTTPGGSVRPGETGASPTAPFPPPLVRAGGTLLIAVPVLPQISNFDDLDPLRLEPGVTLRLLHNGEALPAETDLVLLPGSKATIADLAALRAAGWDHDLHAHVRRGGRVLGLCGGYQMLGRTVADPAGIEGPPATVPGLGLLDIDTVLTGDKHLRSVDGVTIADGVPLRGYEMHVGETTGADTARPLVRLSDERTDGAQSQDGRVAGSYVHGFFAGDRQRAAWLARLGGAAADGAGYDALVDATLDALAAHLAAHLDIAGLLALAR